jgi:hypothetical protein
MALKKDLRLTSPNKPPESSSITHEENEEMKNHISTLDSHFNKLNDKSVKKVDLINTQIEIERNVEELMERKMNEIKEKMKIIMDENKEEMKTNMEQMENNTMESLNGRFPKIDKVFEGTCENKVRVQAEQFSNNKSFLG